MIASQKGRDVAMELAELVSYAAWVAHYVIQNVWFWSWWTRRSSSPGRSRAQAFHLVCAQVWLRVL